MAILSISESVGYSSPFTSDRPADELEAITAASAVEAVLSKLSSTPAFRSKFLDSEPTPSTTLTSSLGLLSVGFPGLDIGLMVCWEVFELDSISGRWSSLSAARLARPRPLPLPLPLPLPVLLAWEASCCGKLCNFSRFRNSKYSLQT